MVKKLHISLVFSSAQAIKFTMHNLYTKFVKILEICKQMSENLVNDHGKTGKQLS